MIVLVIESSCDETAAAIVNDKKEILGQCLLTQLDEHKPFGGVVPEIAARSHLEHIDEIIEHTFKNAGLKPQDVDAIAAASGLGETVNAFEIMPKLFYPYMLLISSLLFIFFGKEKQK